MQACQSLGKVRFPEIKFQTLEIGEVRILGKKLCDSVSLCPKKERVLNGHTVIQHS